MKKTVAASLLLSLLLAGCSGSSGHATGTYQGGYTADSSPETEKEETSSTAAENNTSAESQTTAASPAVPAKNELTTDDVEVHEYLYESPYGYYSMYYISVKNLSELNAEFSANGIAYDADGNMIGSGNGSIDILGPGEESVITMYFSDVTGIDHVDYDLKYGLDPYYDPVITNLDIQSNVNGNNLIVAITNNGEYAAEFVEVTALFMDASDNVVETGSTYVNDADYEIKPGNMQSGQITAFESFDHVIWFVSGRHSQW